ncbi:MAG: flagellar assembly protein FliW [Verrucomicrobia bacterium]|nr:flagellar assembly protein FliW [Verrucomicrobiota bacterium]
MSSQVSSNFEALLKRVAPENVVRFEHGLPGFPTDKQFVLLQNPDERPFVWLQSLNTPELAFVATSPFVLFPEYRPDVPEQDLAAIDTPSSEETLILSLVRIFNSVPPELHTNLKAPIVINFRTFAARQVILANEAMYSEKAIYRVKPV